MKKLVILLVLLLIPIVFALSSQDWINQYQLQNIVRVGSNFKFEVYDVNNKLVNRDPEVGEKFVLSTDADFVWNKVYVYPDNPLNFINSFDLSVKQIGHSVLVKRGKRRGLFTRGRKAVFATYNTYSGISDKIDTSAWTPQDYHLLFWTCTTNRINQWKSTGVWDCSWKAHTFTLNGQATPDIEVEKLVMYTFDPKKIPENVDFSIQVLAENKGASTSIDPEYIWELYDSNNKKIFADDSKFTSLVPTALPPIKSYTANLNFKGQKAGSYVLMVQLDPGGITGDKNLNNNYKSMLINILPAIPSTPVLPTPNVPTTQPGLSDPNNIGPKFDQNKVPGCVTPPQPQTGIWSIDKDTILCPGTYDLPEGVEIIKDGVTFDCNGAKLVGHPVNTPIGTTPISQIKWFHILSDQVTVKNCGLKNMPVFTTSTADLSLIITQPIRDKLSFVNNQLNFKQSVVASDIYLKSKHAVIENNILNQLDVIQSISGEIKNNDAGIISLSSSSSIDISNNEGGGYNIGESKLIKVLNNKLEYIWFSASVEESLIENNILKLNPRHTYVHVLFAIGNPKTRVTIYKKNKIKNNIFDGSNADVYGIWLIFGKENEITGNTIKNTKVGINIGSDLSIENNQITNNNFINNKFTYQGQQVTMQIKDDTESKNSYLNNYFDDFSPTCNDANADNVCDDPYEISTIPAQYSSTGQTIVIEDPTPSKVLN